MMIKCIAVFTLVALSVAYGIPLILEDQYQQYLVVGHYDPEPVVDVNERVRYRRSFAPGAPQIGSTESPYPWSVGGQVDKVGPNTIAKINAGHKNDQTHVTGSWSKVVRGPSKSKPNWSVGVSHRW